MARYTFNTVETAFGGTQEVTSEFDTESLQEIAENFFWFIRAAGFGYVNKITIGNCEFEFA